MKHYITTDFSSNCFKNSKDKNYALDVLTVWNNVPFKSQEDRDSFQDMIKVKCNYDLSPQSLESIESGLIRTDFFKKYLEQLSNESGSYSSDAKSLLSNLNSWKEFPSVYALCIAKWWNLKIEKFSLSFDRFGSKIKGMTKGMWIYTSAQVSYAAESGVRYLEDILSPAIDGGQSESVANRERSKRQLNTIIKGVNEFNDSLSVENRLNKQTLNKASSDVVRMAQDKLEGINGNKR